MNRFQAVTFVVAATLSAMAQAGDAGAGPAATGGPAVGSIVTPGSHFILDTPNRDLSGNRVLPGNGGSVRLAADQIAQTEAVLKGFDGAVVEGAVVRAPTALADGTPAIIALNTKTGVLNVTRRSK